MLTNLNISVLSLSNSVIGAGVGATLAAGAVAFNRVDVSNPITGLSNTVTLPLGSG